MSGWAGTGHNAWQCTPAELAELAEAMATHGTPERVTVLVPNELAETIDRERETYRPVTMGDVLARKRARARRFDVPPSRTYARPPSADLPCETTGCTHGH